MRIGDVSFSPGEMVQINGPEGSLTAEVVTVASARMTVQLCADNPVIVPVELDE